MCRTHYLRWLKYGDPLHTERRSVGRRVPLADRLWHYVTRKGPEECWPWRGALLSRGYGKITVKGKTCGAHRIAYEVTFGPVPAGMVVRHTCDNPPCCNPGHLILGSNADNSRDMVERGRSAGPQRGSGHHNAKLTEDQVRAIRVAHAAGEGGYIRLGRRFGVSPSCVHDIVKRVHWAHLA